MRASILLVLMAKHVKLNASEEHLSYMIYYLTKAYFFVSDNKQGCWDHSLKTLHVWALYKDAKC